MIEENLFITLRPEHRGIVHMTGGRYPKPYSEYPYQDGTLEDFLERVWAQMLIYRDTLNAAYAQIDQEKPGDPSYAPHVELFLRGAHWAFAVARELNPFIPHFRRGPMNDLYQRVVYPLEEIFTKCFAAAHLHGDYFSKIIGLAGLLMDFRHTSEDNISSAVLLYYIAYTQPTREPHRYPHVYCGWRELAEALIRQEAVGEGKRSKRLTELVRYLLHNIDDPQFGFGNPGSSSPAKDGMREQIRTLCEGHKEAVA